MPSLFSCAVFRDYQKWPQLCNDPYEFCFGEKDNVTTSNIAEGCLSELTTMGKLTYNSDCRILFRVSLSLNDDDDYRDVRWRIRIPSDWNYIHLTMWFSPLPNLTTNDGCHSIKIIDDKMRQFTKGYGYYRFEGYNIETDQTFHDDGIITPKSSYSMVNLQEKFRGNEHYSSDFTNSSLVNFIWFDFRSFSILQVERFSSDPINLIHDKLYIYFTLKGEDDLGNRIQIVARRCDRGVLFFPVQSTEERLGDSTKLALVALVAFLMTMVTLGIYVCLTRERHEEPSKGVNVSMEQPKPSQRSTAAADAEHRHMIKKHDESSVSSGGFHHGIETHGIVPH